MIAVFFFELLFTLQAKRVICCSFLYLSATLRQCRSKLYSTALLDFFQVWLLFQKRFNLAG